MMRLPSKRHSLLWLSLVLYCTTSAAQPARLSLTEKYSLYRQRLLNEFMAGVGSDFGQSLPASIRNARDHNFQGTHVLKWGDATIDLAVYIGVLSTEYRLLSRAGNPVTQTLKELYFSLEALNRLDYYAEGYFGARDSLNGFFVRSDVGRGMFDTSGIANQGYSMMIERLNSFTGEPVKEIGSEWMNYRFRNDIRRFAASKDQVIHLLAAMALVVKSVPEGIGFEERRFRDGELTFNAEARRITDRVMAWMHTPGKSNFITNWKLRLPNGKRVGAGYNAWSFSYGMSRAQEALSGTKNPRRRGFSFLAARTVYRFAWFAFKPIYVFNRNEGLLTLTLSALDDQTNAHKIYKRSVALKRHHWFHIPLLAGYLHDEYAPDIDWSFYRGLLTEAPVAGPANTQMDGFESYHWSSTSLLIHPQRRAQAHPHFPGRYNGLDYMLMYNLFLLGTEANY